MSAYVGSNHTLKDLTNSSGQPALPSQEKSSIISADLLYHPLGGVSHPRTNRKLILEEN